LGEYNLKVHWGNHHPDAFVFIQWMNQRKKEKREKKTGDLDSCGSGSGVWIEKNKTLNEIDK